MRRVLFMCQTMAIAICFVGAVVYLLDSAWAAMRASVQARLRCES